MQASNAQSPIAGLGLPGVNSIPCLAPLAIALRTIKLGPLSRNREGMLSVMEEEEDEVDLVSLRERGGGLPGMGEGSGDPFHFERFLGILDVVDLVSGCTGKRASRNWRGNRREYVIFFVVLRERG